MREKLRLSDLSIIYVCLSDDWSTLERRCLSDATYFRNIGGTSIILCHEKSILDREAEKESIPRIYFSADLSTWRSKLNLYFQLQLIFQKQQIDIVHSYNYEALIPLGMILKGSPQIPLIYTFNENIEWKRTSFIERFFVSRTDCIFTFSPNIRELAIESFPINPRKVHVTGAGLDFPVKIKRTIHPQDKKKMVTFISRACNDLTPMRRLVDSIPSILNQLNNLGFEQKLIFTFLTDISWYTHPLYEPLKRMILERHLEMFISFESRPLSCASFQDCDLFMGLPLKELFTDCDLLALITQTPVLVPRTSTRQLAIKQGKFGETYHPEDAREFKDKLVKILVNYSRYLDELKGIEVELQEQHHFERYAEELYAHYEKLHVQRLRYTQKKKKLA
jgi:glycosyltransferase involved in cell wall biosynthesis